MPAVAQQWHLLSPAIMVEVTSRHIECIHLNLDCSQMSAVAQKYIEIKMNSVKSSECAFYIR